ncbi:MAG: hypothetical protein ACLFNI_10180, partial [Natronomonas sp.]
LNLSSAITYLIIPVVGYISDLYPETTNHALERQPIRSSVNKEDRIANNCYGPAHVPGEFHLDGGRTWIR